MALLDPGDKAIIQKIHDTHISLYDLLEVKKDATEDEIARGYKKVAMKHHPDRWKGDLAEMRKKVVEAERAMAPDPLTPAERERYTKEEDKFKYIGIAFDILKNKRFSYDAEYRQFLATPKEQRGSAAQQTPQAAQQPQATGPSPSQPPPQAKPKIKVELSDGEADLIHWFAFHKTQDAKYFISRGGNLIAEALRDIGLKVKFETEAKYRSGIHYDHSIYFSNRQDSTVFRDLLNEAAMTCYREFEKVIGENLNRLGIKIIIGAQPHLVLATNNLYVTMEFLCNDASILAKMVDTINQVHRGLIEIDPTNDKRALLNPDKLGIEPTSKLAVIKDALQRLVQSEVKKPPQPSAAPRPSAAPQPSAPQPSAAPQQQGPNLFARSRREETILIYKTQNGDLAVKFPNKEMRDACLAMLGSLPTTEFQKKLFSHMRSCPHLVQGKDNMFYIPAETTTIPQTQTQQLAGVFASVQQRDTFYEIFQLKSVRTVSPHKTHPRLYFQDPKLFDRSLGYDACMKIPVPEVLKPQFGRSAQPT